MRCLLIVAEGQTFPGCNILILNSFSCSDSISKTPRREEIIDGLSKLPTLIRKVLEGRHKVKELAMEMLENPSILVMGRGYNSATCMEGALKIKELTYLLPG